MTKRIRILATSDLHGSITPYDYRTGNGENMGLAKIKTLTDSLKDENTLILDNGDTIQGSMPAYFHYLRFPDDVSPMTTAMNEIEYDYVNVGNHDFNYGEEALMMHLQNLKSPCITSNFLFHGRPWGPTYVIREFDGVKVALFALTTPYLTHWEKKKNILHCRFTDVIETAKKTIATVKKLEKPDYIVCMYHGGLEKDPKTGFETELSTGENQAYELVQQVPGIDVLITGHQHRTVCEKIRNTWVTQTESDGRQIACIDIFPEAHIVDARILDADMPADENILKLTKDEEDACRTWLDTSLGTSTVDLSIRDEDDARLHKSQAVTFLNTVVKDLTNADICVTALPTGTTGFPENITMRSLLTSFPEPNTFVVKHITGKQLRLYLEHNAEYFTPKNAGVGINPEFLYPKKTGGRYDMADGIEYTITVSEPVGCRITSLTYKGDDVTDDMEFNIAFNNFRANGGHGFTELAELPTVMTYNTSMIEAVTEYLHTHNTVNFEPTNNITITLY